MGALTVNNGTIPTMLHCNMTFVQALCGMAAEPSSAMLVPHIDDFSPSALAFRYAQPRHGN